MTQTDEKEWNVFVRTVFLILIVAGSWVAVGLVGHWAWDLIRFGWGLSG